MKSINAWIVAMLVSVPAFGAVEGSAGTSPFVSGFMILVGVGIATLWTFDLVSQRRVDSSNGLARTTDVETGQRMLPHLIAEYATAALLVAGGLGLLKAAPWSQSVSLVALGALAYTSLNSLGWVVSANDRLAYGVPLVVSLVGACVCLATLL